ncbi:MAG: TldD/PmbA family protein [Thermovirgaceae bacterium]|nr:TldD/PmbA family protein [Thermovirgaceae bacterium]
MQIPGKREAELIAEWLMGSALKKGAVMADILYSAGSSAHFSLRDGSPEKDTQGASFRIGCRVIDAQGRQGVADMNSLSRDVLENLIEACMANCRASEPESDLYLFRGESVEKEQPMVFDPEVGRISHEERERRCMEMSDLAAGADKRVVSVRQSSWGDGFGETMYASSENILRWYEDSFAACSVTVVMEDGESLEMGGASEESRRAGGVDHLLAAREAVERTALTLGGKPAPTGVYDVVFDPEAAASLVESVGDLFLASAVYKNRSLLKGRMGEKIGSDCLSLVDDGTLSWGIGSAPWDGEGVPTGRTVLMDRGKVSSFLYDLKYARRFGAAPTGNASRSPGSLPGVGFTNLCILPGARGMEEILRDNRGGILVTELMGVHTIDPVSGDFSLGIKGALIENGGAAVRPVAGMTVAGNLLGLLGNISEVGKGLRFFGDIGGCPVVVKDVSMAGS